MTPSAGPRNAADHEDTDMPVDVDDQPILQTNVPGLPVRRGKVRDIYDLGDEILLVATDRISAFDVVLPSGIPGKGRMLTQISTFWFNRLADRTPHHLIGPVEKRPPVQVTGHLDQLGGRTMLCRKTDVIPIEFVVRGYLAGSGWKSYRETGQVCGVKLPPGLRQCQQLPEPIFTPATKVEAGHDENVSFEQACEITGGDTMRRLRSLSIELFVAASAYARQRGVIIADTKFEFGRLGKELLLIDEALTPDSSRFWPADTYSPGRDQDSFDKQYVRNYLQSLVDAGRWDKNPPAPPLPDDVVRSTAARYREAVHRLTGP
jgi:phosphoribosylaminoimidazole-succinocarboxamide synthase